ncbi:hypothetical protein SERLA73DRAFT_178219 [Serpula lacrymans var. lacrymans S7.3]|uniref:Hydrophobin n=2 Tax=Serpula lacrymans var. lacrymans TaxID=341189 RepID=F8PR44_SERL3|nr:hydrophobin [Serpula lacrymans var. lacrymans S7.9]EGO02335.1 hypothetical protein SERLA73DRAFT_178219 [Serpula lacrymans var. lacrymans S7.3]EGO28069.1 hydrophobin [Serpula lacrymans var. lacrymans S7.9]
MFARISTVVLATLPLLALAATNQCETGSAYCCNSVQNATDAHASNILEELGIAVDGVTGQVGFGCSPLSVVGVGAGSSCKQEPVCCTKNSFNGAINLGCSPLSL